MRPVMMSFWISLDGYSADLGRDTELSRLLEAIEDPDQEEHFVRWLCGAGTHIMGRTTYQEMAEFWPKSDHPIAAPMNDIPKVVFSRTLESAGWPEARIARGDTAAEVARLKQEPGGPVIAHGGTQFARSLTRLGLIDEYHLWVLPAAAGSGAPLFTGLDHPLPLELVTSRAFPSGILELVYAPRR
jgi:dihydrofolate reductase